MTGSSIEEELRIKLNNKKMKGVESPNCMDKAIVKRVN
jgi:hypothetical protein